MSTETMAEPVVLQVESDGGLALPRPLLSPAGLHEGDRVLVFPLRSGLLYLYKIDAPEPLSREKLSALMRDAFESSGYTTREQVLTLVRETRRELAQEW